MFKLTKGDKRVIDAFIDQRPAESKKLISDGTHLDGLWMGGAGIAWWGPKYTTIRMQDLGSKAAQTVQRAIAKKVPRNWLDPANFSGGRGGLSGARGPDLDPQQERMLDEIVLMAVNDGRYYPSQPAISVGMALKEYSKIKLREMEEDAQIIRRHAVREVQRQWRQR